MMLLAVPGEGRAGNLGFLAKTAVGKFSADDLRILQATALTLLKDGATGQSQEWSNPNSTAKGTLTIVKVFNSTEGYLCKSVRSENSANGLHGRATYPVCEIQPGDWKLHSQAKPAAP
jgi:surface antigen